MTTNPWAWHDGHNPYRSTPFQILDLSPDLVGRGQIRAQIQQRRRRIERTARRFPLFGRTLSVADVNRAEEDLGDVERRLHAELLTHRPAADEGDDLVDRLTADFAELPVPAPPPVPADVHEQALLRLLPGLDAVRPPARCQEGLLP